MGKMSTSFSSWSICSSSWFCDSVELKNLQNNELKCFSVHQWLDQLSDQSQFSITNYRLISCDNPIDNSKYQYYLVRIKTDTTNFTSMNAMKISVKLFGKSHQTEFIPLTQTIDHQSRTFQQNNSIDTFEIRTPIKLNSLEKLQLSYEILANNGQISFQWIEINNLGNGKIFCFPLNSQLLTAINRQDKTEQLLSLTVSNTDKCS